MPEKVECISPGSADCNGCSIVNRAKEALEREPTRPVSDVLDEVGEANCPDGRRPAWRETTLSESGRI